MYQENLKDDFFGIKIELVDLNQSTFFYATKANRLKYLFQKTSRKFMIEELISLRYLENGIILHLTNLDDDRAKFSFQSILKKLNKISVEQTKLKELKRKIKEYRIDVNFLKSDYRNKRIAHSNSLKYPKIDDFIHFEELLKPLVSEANEIGDYLFDKKLDYKFKFGTMDGILNFRELLENMKIDFKSTNEF